MDYAEALKKVSAIKPKENYMAIEMAYDRKVILPYKDGVAFMTALNSAEEFKESYNEQSRIIEFSRDSIKVSLMSHAEYIRIKIAALLGVKPDEVKEAEATAA